ncbi:hypothetical protein C0989_006692 [Termitomyces sp. Mn162]|nr:hypothetical protein C0989_006692 [Termitomyces sp. Mn162]
MGRGSMAVQGDVALPSYAVAMQKLPAWGHGIPLQHGGIGRGCGGPQMPPPMNFGYSVGPQPVWSQEFQQYMVPQFAVASLPIAGPGHKTGMAGQQQPATMLSQVGISFPASAPSEAMEVDNDGSELITALMQPLAPQRQSYLPLPTVVHLSNASSSLSSVSGHPADTLTNKGKGKVTATLPSTLIQGSSTPLLTAWKMVEQCFSEKEKGKGKAKEPEPSTAADEQIAHLLQQLHEARVLEDIRADILNNSVVQLAPSQVLNKLDIVCN